MGGSPLTAVGGRAVVDGPRAGKRHCLSLSLNPAVKGWQNKIPCQTPGAESI